MSASTLLAGFADPVFDSQTTFRAALAAMAYPGRIVTVPHGLDAPAPLGTASAALALALLDFETPFWLDAAAGTGAAASWLGFHCGAPVVSAAGAARFGLVAAPDAMPTLADFAAGDAEYPDRSATLIVQVPSFETGPERVWRGPGIDGRIAVRADGLPARFWEERDLNHEIYPAGIDVFLACGPALIGLPRGIMVEG